MPILSQVKTYKQANKPKSLITLQKGAITSPMSQVREPRLSDRKSFTWVKCRAWVLISWRIVLFIRHQKIGCFLCNFWPCLTQNFVNYTSPPSHLPLFLHFELSVKRGSISWNLKDPMTECLLNTRQEPQADAIRAALGSKAPSTWAVCSGLWESHICSALNIIFFHR